MRGRTSETSSPIAKSMPDGHSPVGYYMLSPFLWRYHPLKTYANELA